MFDAKEYQRKWHQEHREEQNAKQRQRYAESEERRKKAIASVNRWKAENPEKAKEVAEKARAKAKERGYKPQLTPEQVAHARETTRQWRKDHKDVVVGYREERSRLQASVREGRISRKKLWEQCGGICGICGQPIDRSIEYPDNMSLSYDHIIPLSKGGKHIQDNIQCCHRICNTRKRDHVL